jgi:beta-glucoside operon transcriptional antiterminator
MQVVKKINNNVAVCVDSDGNELVAFGKGIGFPKTPYELNDLSLIERTFYGIEKGNLALLEQIDKKYFDAAARIVDYGSARIEAVLNPNIVFTLADHIAFAIDRTKKGMYVKMPHIGALQARYPAETEIAHQARLFLNKQFGIHLTQDEEASIAMHFINAESYVRNKDDEEIDMIQVTDDITRIIEEYYGITIDRKGFNYSRFVTHLEYLISRKETHAEVLSENEKMFESVRNENSRAYECSTRIAAYVKESMQWQLNNEELLYLMLHINRLTSRES